MRAATSLAVFLLPLMAAAQVTQVTVHPDGAVVTRSMAGQCKAGRAEVLFQGLPPTFERDGLRAVATGAASVEGLGWTERLQEQAYDEQVQALEQELEERQASIDLQNRLADVARAKRARAVSLRESTRAFIQREAMLSPKPDTAKWAQALDRAQTSIEQADREVRETQRIIREESERITELRRRIGQLKGGAPRRSLDVEVVVACKGPFTVALSALTRQARWVPVYEARAARQAGKVALTALAEVSQGSGEDWQGVKLVLSTALARRRATPPVPQRLYVGATEEEEKKKVLVRRDEDVRRLEGHDATAATGGLDVSDEGLSVRLPVKGRASVPADGRPARLPIETLSLPATFEALTVPRQLPVVFVAAEVRNAARWPLLPGRVELFADGAYLGATQLARTAEGGRIELAFGLDERVQVRRVVLVEDARDPGFFGTTRRMLYGYRFELEATKDAGAKVRLRDQIPVSELDDVKVVLDRKKTTPGFELVDADGHISWLVDVPAGQTKTVELHFVVELPEKYDSAGL